jgi:type II secretory pathway pseudopilin PulG
MAVLVALMSTLLMAALAAALVLSTTAETMVAANFREGQQAVYAADAAIELAIADLAAAPDWTPLLDGSVTSALPRNPPDPRWTLPDRSPLELTRLVNRLNCRNANGCTAAALSALTAQRPWGANNPMWRLYAYGPLPAFVPGSITDSTFFIVVMLADDAAENDGDPLRDGSTGTNPGSGVVMVRAEAFGTGGTHLVVEATAARDVEAATPARVQIWSRRIAR